LADSQFIYPQVARFFVFYQLEPGGEKSAKHQGNLWVVCSGRQARFDVVFVVVDPRRTSDLIDLTMPRLCDQAFQRDVSTSESITGIRDLVVVVGPNLVLAGPD